MTETPLVSVVDDAELLDPTTTDAPAAYTEAPEPLPTLPNPPLDTAEQEGLVDAGALPPPQPEGPPRIPLPERPGLRRNVSVPSPAPLGVPPPVPTTALSDPAAQSGDPLSLSELQRLVDKLPTVDFRPYAFKYDDASSLEDELEEWFSYTVEEQAMLLKAHTAFSDAWSRRNERTYEGGECDWSDAEPDLRREFLRSLLDRVKGEPADRLPALEAVVYVLLGCWHETAGQTMTQETPAETPEPETEDSSVREDSTLKSPYEKSAAQVDLIRKNARLVVDIGGLPTLVDTMRSVFLRASNMDVAASTPQDVRDAEKREVWCAMTAVYILLEVARIEEKDKNDLSFREKFLQLESGLFLFLVEIIGKIRWDETIPVPLTKLFLLAWKTALVTFGGLSEVQKAKESFADKDAESHDTRGQPIITASPLDYHVFRQEIISKYPAYEPPPNLFPLEPENNSILPPLKNHPNKAAGHHVFGSALGDIPGNTTSIFQQPIHIATPAPSPPPSPAGPGGKGGKKQNYQTNQMFPFLYPPLDESSNNIGGKGSTELQDLLVGRKWEGPDIPTSILEAAELFSKRMRATRGMKQLWEERVQFMKYERGWTKADDDDDVDELSLEPKEGASKEEAHPAGSIEERMALVEECYRTTLPHLQSLVVVMIKGILIHVTSLVTQSQGPNGLQGAFQYQDNQNGANGANGANGHGAAAPTNDEIDSLRTQEILDKAVYGLLMLLMKWFKISHVLKFEYLTQLLVDANYVPLALKFLQLQEVDKAVNTKLERKELNFFTFCRSHSRHASEEESHEEADPAGDGDEHHDDSEDALPPPIRRDRDDASAAAPRLPHPISVNPEVDELGNPTTDIPEDPITSYSWRMLATNINVLRTTQKVCKNKVHRILMLVTYKSSQFLKKNLKIPEPVLRLYTLKLFKNQVPYCGRKWRQSNMRVITAVYLTCRPDLRDDWLAGSDVDAEVDESVPLEQALRALTHWWNCRRYPEAMGARRGALDDEVEFFRRELEKMDWAVGQGQGDGIGEDGDADGSGWDVQIDGW